MTAAAAPKNVTRPTAPPPHSAHAQKIEADFRKSLVIALNAANPEELLTECQQKALHYFESKSTEEQTVGYHMLSLLARTTAIPLVISVQAIGALLDALRRGTDTNAFFAEIMLVLQVAFTAQKFEAVRTVLVRQLATLHQEQSERRLRMMPLIVVQDLLTRTSVAPFLDNATRRDLFELLINALIADAARQAADIAAFAAVAIGKSLSSGFVPLTMREELMGRIVNTIRNAEMYSQDARLILLSSLHFGAPMLFTHAELLQIISAIGQLFAEHGVQAAVQQRGGKIALKVWGRCVAVPTATPEFQEKILTVFFCGFQTGRMQCAEQYSDAQKLDVMRNFIELVNSTAATLPASLLKSFDIAALTEKLELAPAKLQNEHFPPQRTNSPVIMEIAGDISKLAECRTFATAFSLAETITDSIQRYAEPHSHTTFSATFAELCKIVKNAKYALSAREAAAWTLANTAIFFGVGQARNMSFALDSLLYDFPASSEKVRFSQKGILTLTYEAWRQAMLLAEPDHGFDFAKDESYYHTASEICAKRLKDLVARLLQLGYVPHTQIIFAEAIAYFLQGSYTEAHTEAVASLKTELLNVLQDAKHRVLITETARMTLETAAGCTVTAQDPVAVQQLCDMLDLENFNMEKLLVSDKLIKAVLENDAVPAKQKAELIQKVLQIMLHFVHRHGTNEALMQYAEILAGFLSSDQLPPTLWRQFQKDAKAAAVGGLEQPTRLYIAITVVTYAYSCNYDKPREAFWELLKELADAAESADMPHCAVIAWNLVMQSPMLPRAQRIQAANYLLESLDKQEQLNDLTTATNIRNALRSCVISSEDTAVASYVLLRLALIVCSAEHSVLTKQFAVNLLALFLQNELLTTPRASAHMLVSICFWLVLSQNVSDTFRHKLLTALAYFQRAMGVGNLPTDADLLQRNVTRELLRICEDQVFYVDVLKQCILVPSTQAAGSAAQNALALAQRATDPKKQKGHKNDAALARRYWEAACEADWSRLYASADMFYRDYPRLRQVHEEDGTYVDLGTDQFYTEDGADIHEIILKQLHILSR